MGIDCYPRNQKHIYISGIWKYYGTYTWNEKHDNPEWDLGNYKIGHEKDKGWVLKDNNEIIYEGSDVRRPFVGCHWKDITVSETSSYLNLIF